MLCPHCGHDFGEGMLPARCPECGRPPVSSAEKDEFGAKAAKRAAASREQARGISQVGAEHERKRKKLTFFSATKHASLGALAVGIVAALVCAVVFLGWHVELWGGRGLEDMTGWSAVRAEKHLRDLGYQVALAEEYSDESQGAVVGQEPSAGSRAEKGSTVTLKVSKERVMPEVVGKSLDEVRKLFEAMHQEVKTKDVYDDGAAGVVLKASVAPGERLESKKVVELSVSKARELPDLVGKTQEEAERTLEDMGVKAKIEFVSAKDDQREGGVVEMSPAKSTKVKAGDMVTLKVAANYVSKIEKAARDILKIVYDGNPLDNDYRIGAELRTYLSESLTIGGKKAKEASNKDIYYALVKAHEQLDSGAPSQLGLLPRTLDSVDECRGSKDGKVEATVTVSWDWSALGSDYAGVSSTDQHKVTLSFDKEGKLNGFADYASDVPAYEMS